MSSETEERGGSVMIGVGDAPETVALLAERKVFVDWRPGVGLRISPHFFNTEEDVDRLFRELHDLL